MKRPLGKHFDFVNVSNGWRSIKGLLTLLVVFLSFNLSTAQTFSRIECQCLNNSTTDDNGQFTETISINSNSGESWIVVSSSGLYDITSPAPPAAPIPLADATVIPEGLPGQYILDAKRLNNTDWRLEVTNGAVVVPIASTHRCTYPSNIVVGDMGTCIGTIESYQLDIPSSQLGSITWSISGGGNIVGGQGTPRIFVDWGDAAGNYQVSFTGTAGSYDGQINDFCDFSGSADVGVMDEEAFALACNNQVNISLNGNCDLDITADMLLEDMEFTNDSYDLIIRDIEEDTIVTGATLGMEYINTQLEVSVVHECSGNSCWGYILLEDKSIPPLQCGTNDTINCNEFMTPDVTGFPVPDDVIITPLGDDKFLLENFDKCSDAILFYEDTPITTNLCDGPFSSIIERAWVVEDNSGNKAYCTERIYVNKATLMDITFPPSYDDVLGPNSSLEACSNFPKLPNGYPDPSYTGMPEGIFCLNVKVDYEDTELPKCGDESYKLRRRWIVQDLCDGTYLPPYTQNITVVDHTKPTCIAPPDFTVGSTETSCSSIIEVPAPTITDCSSTSYTVSWNPFESGVDPFFQPSNDGVVQHANGYLISDIPDGVTELWILYYATDACDNVSTCSTKVTIEDDIQPIPVCDLHTFVGLNENGVGYADIESFDDGSWDNCEIDYLEVRRMENSACGETVNWGQKVKFCCDDIGEIVMVQLRVVDKSGNSNVCMVEAEVQDNHFPEITFCPADITIDCDDDLVNLDQYGTAIAIDNCNVKVTSTTQRNINSCGTGTITRNFRAEDDQGNFVTCQQIITVLSLDPFYINPNNANDPFDDIIWPGDHTLLNGCASTGAFPDDLPVGKQRPEILREACSQISFTYKDVIFQYTDEACYKILRTWKVIDDCVYVPFGNVGFWEYTQVIKVENSTKPTITSGCQASDFTITQLSNCSARIEGAVVATDDCTPTDDLVYTYKFDEDNNGSIDFTGQGTVINRTVEFGSHRVIWEVEDECGNVQTCAVVISVDDDKAPSPYCLTEIVTVVMETSGSVTIWASDFDLGSFDNCADQDEIVASFSPNINDTSIEFTCDDMDGEATSFELEVYFTDPAGNQDFCTTALVVQDNQNYCGNSTNEASRVSLGGNIYNDENENVEGIHVTLKSNLPEFPLFTETDANGGYSFNNLLVEESYTLQPKLDKNYNEGVSTLDLVLIQQHLLEIKKLNNPYKVIAADINNSGSISASDLLQLRKLILGIYSELPSNDSWRFVDASYEFTDVNDPFPFEDNVNMGSMKEDYMDADFVAIKIGDVNNSASTNLKSEKGSTTRSSKQLRIVDQYLEVGTHDVEISLEETDDIYGLQFALIINDNLISDVHLASDVLNVTEGNYSRDAKLLVSIHEAQSVFVGDNILTLILDVKKAGYLSEMIGLSEGDFANELYTAANGSVQSSNLGLEIQNRSNDVVHTFELLQNVPNPFTTTTEIGFVLPEDEKVTLRVMDMTGKILISRSGRYTKGYNAITLDVSEINGSGILYYQLDTERNSASKKMIIIK